VERASQLVSTTLLTRGQSTAILIKLANYSLAPLATWACNTIWSEMPCWVGHWLSQWLSWSLFSVHFATVTLAANGNDVIVVFDWIGSATNMLPCMSLISMYFVACEVAIKTQF